MKTRAVKFADLPPGREFCHNSRHYQKGYELRDNGVPLNAVRFGRESVYGVWFPPETVVRIATETR